jgi:hypothetical protein
MLAKVFRTDVLQTMLIAAVTAGSIAVTACDRLVGLPLPSDAEQFSPPAVYSTWWNMTQACSGQTGSLGAVTWFKTSKALHDPRTGEVIIGYWVAGSNWIVLETTAMRDGGAVRHEMLHALLQQGGHPRNQFLGKCAGTVSCAEACVRDAGPYPQPPDPPIHVQADSIDMAVDVEPANPNSGYDGGFFSITVVAHNRSMHWATVLPVFSVTDSARTFSFDVRGPTGGLSIGDIALDPSERIFAPGETKKKVFDFVIGDDPFSQQLQPGNYSVRGAFSDIWSSYSSFVVGQ